MVECDYANFSHVDLQHSRVPKKEAYTQALTKILDKSWVNHFNTEHDELICLSTPTVPPQDVAHDLKS
jgi:hypothetical protein